VDLFIKSFFKACDSFMLHASAATPWQLSFQQPSTPTMEGIIRFHHDLMFLMVLIVVFVGYMMARCLYHFNEEKNPVALQIVHGSVIEVVWTLIPAFILMVIAVPSFALLYSADELIEPALTLKVVGHQWYWSYEFADYANEDGETVNFDSYMIPEEDLATGDFRLLEVDQRVVLPVSTHIRVIVTAADVLHCWALPSAAVKMDACPGRLNQTSLFFKREGVFYGQCSEICGVNHAFMPIVVESRSLDDYITWIQTRLEDALFFFLLLFVFTNLLIVFFISLFKGILRCDLVWQFLLFTRGHLAGFFQRTTKILVRCT
jgi:cytochrome c oxidase subunit 2